MLTQHIALVPESEGVSFSELTRVSAALQRQVTRDLAASWGISATVDAFPRLEDVPVGYWPVLLTHCELGRQGGVHLDAHGQPYAQVQLGAHWSLAASRACLEMLVNPYGTSTVSAPSLRSDQGPVEFLVEVCGPCGDPCLAYAINGVAVSDFCTPAFFGCGALNDRFSFTGAATAPMQPLPGGHMTWYDPVSGSYWMRNHWGDNPIDTKLGYVRGAGGGAAEVSVREVLNACAPLRAQRERRLPPSFAAHEDSACRASQVHAQRLRALLGRRLDAQVEVAGEVASAQPSPQWLRRAQQVAAPASHPLDPSDFESEPTPAVEATAALPDYQLVDPLDLEEVTQPARAQQAPRRSTPPPLEATRRTRSEVPPPPPPRAERAPSLSPVTLASAPKNAPAEGVAGIRRSLPALLGAVAAIGLVWFAAHSTEPRTTTPAPTNQGAAIPATAEVDAPAQGSAPTTVSRPIAQTGGTPAGSAVEPEQRSLETSAEPARHSATATPEAAKPTVSSSANDSSPDARSQEARARRRARRSASTAEPPPAPAEPVAASSVDADDLPSIEALIETRR